MPIGIYEKDEIDAIAITIRECKRGGSPMTTAEMPDAIREVRESGFGDGFSEGDIWGRQQGRAQGLEEGKTEAYAEVESINSELEQTLYGTDTGGKSFYDEFWDNFQNYGKRGIYSFAFRASGFEYIRPKYKIVPNVVDSVGSMFRGSEKLKKIEAAYFDFSQLPYSTYVSGAHHYTFNACFALEEIEDVGLSPIYSYSQTFSWDTKLHTIAKITVDENTGFDNAFYRCDALVNLTIAGVIGNNGFNVQWSTKLSKASITSIINALSSTTSGLTVTLSKTAVNNAFVGGSTGEEWLNLIATKSNWNISLV